MGPVPSPALVYDATVPSGDATATSACLRGRGTSLCDEVDEGDRKHSASAWLLFNVPDLKRAKMRAERVLVTPWVRSARLKPTHPPLAVLCSFNYNHLPLTEGQLVRMVSRTVVDGLHTLRLLLLHGDRVGWQPGQRDPPAPQGGTYRGRAPGFGGGWRWPLRGPGLRPLRHNRNRSSFWLSLFCMLMSKAMFPELTRWRNLPR